MTKKSISLFSLLFAIKKEPNQMKKLFIVLFSALSLSMSAQHMATPDGAVGLNSSKDRVVLKMTLDTELTETEKSEILKWSAANTQFLTVEVSGKSFTILTLAEKWDRNVIFKAFRIMNIEKVMGSQGKTMSPEEFVNSINL
jgi:hypothetical protein